MKGFYINVTNNLLEGRHIRAIGSAVWEFMWCLDKITKIDKGLGYVLGGRPIKLKEIADELEKAEVNISRNLHKLEKAGYLSLKTAPYGVLITVHKAKKRFNDIVKPRNDIVKPNKTVSIDNKHIVSDSAKAEPTVSKPMINTYDEERFSDDGSLVVDVTTGKTSRLRSRVSKLPASVPKKIDPVTRKEADVLLARYLTLYGKYIDTEKPVPIFNKGAYLSLVVPHLKRKELGLKRLLELLEAYIASDDLLYHNNAWSITCFLSAKTLHKLNATTPKHD